MISASDLSVRWRTSTYSTNGGDCVEIGEGLPSAVPVRDSKDPEGPALVFPVDTWSAFVADVKARRFPLF